MWRALSCLALALVGGACELPFEEDLPECEGWKPGDLVITELLPDPEGPDTGQEWLELYNPGSAAVDLRGLLLYAARADGSQERAYLFEDAVPVEPKDYVVLGDVRTGTPPAHVDHAYGDALGALGNTGGLVGVRCGDVVVDEVRYAGPIHSGVARVYDGRLAPDAVGNDEAARWCDAPAPAPDGGFRGSPGAVNPACPGPIGGSDKGVSTDGGVAADTCVVSRTGASRSVVHPQPGDLVLTEIMADPKAVSDSQGEWVEVYALRDVDLNGVLLTNEGSGRTAFSATPCLELKAGTFGVLARTADAALNGGLPPVLGTFGFSLNNSARVHALRLSWNGVLLDEVQWTSAPVAGVSRQLDPSRKDPTRNDAEQGFCLTPEGVRYNTEDRGTPGAENRPCAP